ncbi:MAG: haloacid dehalogenase-like hydrolase, partial [Pseudomonadota bacterium]
MKPGQRAASVSPAQTNELAAGPASIAGTRVVFDFDGTLRSGDAFIGFFLTLLRGAPVRWLGVVLAAPLAIVAGLLPDGRRRFASVLLWVATAGVAEEAFRTAMRDHARAQGSRERFYEEGLACLRAHQDAGDEPVIVTGAAEDLVVELLRERGVDVPVIGSQLNRTAGGMVCTDHCFGRRKLALLAKRGYPATWQWTYSDSAAD